jgi:hypothetical protein
LVKKGQFGKADISLLKASSRLALMAVLLGMIARPGQPKSTPAVIAMATLRHPS